MFCKDNRETFSYNKIWNVQKNSSLFIHNTHNRSLCIMLLIIALKWAWMEGIISYLTVLYKWRSLWVKLGEIICSSKAIIPLFTIPIPRGGKGYQGKKPTRFCLTKIDCHNVFTRSSEMNTNIVVGLGGFWLVFFLPEMTFNFKVSFHYVTSKRKKKTSKIS